MRLRSACILSRPSNICFSRSGHWSNQRLSSTVSSIETYPSPTCSCADTPDLEIDREKPLINTISPTLEARRCTKWARWLGKANWRRQDGFQHSERALLGPKGPSYDVHTLDHHLVWVNSQADYGIPRLHPTALWLRIPQLSLQEASRYSRMATST